MNELDRSRRALIDSLTTLPRNKIYVFYFKLTSGDYRYYVKHNETLITSGKVDSLDELLPVVDSFLQREEFKPYTIKLC